MSRFLPRDPVRARHARRYFKTGPGESAEGDRFLGSTVPQVRQAACGHRDLPESEVIRLLRSGFHEERLMALFILVARFPSAPDRIFRLYMRHRRHVNHWDLVDNSAGHIVGRYLEGRSKEPLPRLARSKRIWDRRIAIIATSHEIREGRFRETLRIARILLQDEHDLIHKAVGWMLREVGNRDRRTLERFLDRHIRRMPRTMLRYAIERLPESRRRRHLNARVRDEPFAGQRSRRRH